MGEQRRHVGFAVRQQISDGILGRGRDALQLVEPVGLLLGAIGNELRGEELAERRIFLPPAETHQGEHRVGGLLLGLRSCPLVQTHGIAAEQDQARHPLGMPDRITDGDGAALADAEQDEAVEAGGVDHGFEIVHETLERDVRHVAVRQAVAARVVADQRVIARQFAIEMPPDRTFQIEFEMRHPVAGLDDRRPLPGFGPGQLHAVLGLAEVDVLLGKRLAAGSGSPIAVSGSDMMSCARKPVNADGARDVLHRLLAEIGERQRQLVPDLLVGGARDADAAGLAQRFEPGGNVDAVAENVVAVDDDVADIDADPEHDLLVVGDGRVALQHRALHFHGTTRPHRPRWRIRAAGRRRWS